MPARALLLSRRVPPANLDSNFCVTDGVKSPGAFRDAAAAGCQRFNPERLKIVFGGVPNCRCRSLGYIILTYGFVGLSISG